MRRRLDTPCDLRRTIAALLAAATVLAQPAPLRAAETDDRSPDAADLAGAYLALRDWVVRFDPPDPDDAASRHAIGDASGVCVILRMRGRVVGSGTDTTGDDLMLRRAAGRALSEARASAAASALPDALRDELGHRLTIELEAAGPLVPLPGRAFDDVAQQIEPGLDGIALRRDGAVALRFPSQMLATNTAGRPERILPALAIDLDLPARPYDELRARWNVRAYRFRTVHLVQRAPGRTPVQTVRGQTLVRDEDVTADVLAAFAQDLMNHLITTIWPGPEPFGVMGNYAPIPDRYDPVIAPAREQALAALAFARAAAIGQLHPTDRPRASTGASILLTHLAHVHEGEEDPLADPVACAAIVFACSALDAVGGDGPDETAVVALRAGAVDALRGAAPATLPPDPHGRAVVASARARLLHEHPGAVTAASVRDELDALWSTVPGHLHVSMLPWIAWAEDDHARAVDGPLDAAGRLARLRDLLDASRIGSQRLPGARDLHGGFALTRPRAGVGSALADAQTVRPATFTAWALRHPELTPPDTAAIALGRHLRTVRFLLQLRVTDDLLWAAPNPQRAIGGLRAAPWDHRQPAAAQSMALLCVAETLAGLDAITARARPETP